MLLCLLFFVEVLIMMIDTVVFGQGLGIVLVGLVCGVVLGLVLRAFWEVGR